MPKPRRSATTPSGPPFGIPDASSAGLEQVTRDFVDFAQSGIASDLASRANDRSVRIVVGKKGVGKTLYLRRFQASAQKEPSVYVSRREFTPPGTEEIVNLSQCFSTELVTEGWKLVWKRAMYRAIASHLRYARDLRELPWDDLRRLGDYAIVPDSGRPTSVYNEVRDIASEFSTTSHKLTRYLGDRQWDAFEYDLEQLLRNAPPIYFFLDAIDDYFQHAPLYWLECQKGLFHEAVELFQREGFRRLHLLVCIRDSVYSSVLRTEHASRYIGDPHIRVLDWDARAIQFFFREKLDRLAPHYKMRPEAEGVEGWLGTSTIGEEGEALEAYLLRHTRLIPRDVVLLGNFLCDAVTECKRNEVDVVPEARIEDIVATAARGFADEQLRICASQIAADQIPEHAAHHGLTDMFTGSQVYSQGVFDQLAGLLRTFGRQRFEAGGLELLRQRTADEFDGHHHIPDVLWQNGLLGYERDASRYAHFYAGTSIDDFNLPAEQASYVLHPCLSHRLRVASARPAISGYALA